MEPIHVAFAEHIVGSMSPEMMDGVIIRLERLTCSLKRRMKTPPRRRIYSRSVRARRGYCCAVRVETPDLISLIRDPSRVAEVQHDHVPVLLAQIAAVQSALTARLLAVPSEQGRISAQSPVEEDRLLTVKEAAARLRVSTDYLYRNWRRLPFTVRPTPKSLRFSALGIAWFIRQRNAR